MARSLRMRMRKLICRLRLASLSVSNRIRFVWTELDRRNSASVNGSAEEDSDETGAAASHRVLRLEIEAVLAALHRRGVTDEADEHGLRQL